MSIEPIELGQKLKTYCENFAVPIDYIFDILNDQKVVPMIRGKATEYQGYLVTISKLIIANVGDTRIINRQV